MDLSTLSDEELKLELDKAMNEEVLNNNLQMGMKILLNAGFGALGNEHFLYFKVENAEAITLTGQLVNRWTGTRVNKFLKDRLDPDHDYHIYSDTDSVGGDSIINVNGKDITISEYYDICPELYIKHDEEHDDYVKSTKSLGHITPSVSATGKLRYNAISYVMKHKVKKRMFRVEVDGKSVDVTEDHSLIVKRDGVLISCKPEDVQEGDIMLKLE